MFQVAEIEQAGIPTCSLLYEDQDATFEEAGMLSGSPGMRRVWVSRTLPGPEDVAGFFPKVIDALTKPLTEKEKSYSGRYELPYERVLFEGTLEDAQEFYSQSRTYPSLRYNAPISLYTDGLPIVIPTEERVEAMLKGTSHSPDEVITVQSNSGPGFRIRRGMSVGKKGDAVRFQPVLRTATVEQVAINAVMSGCRPEYLPVVLAAAEAGGGGGPDGRGSVGYVVSGPIAKEIGMNFDVGLLGPGNQANRSLGRCAELMWRNFGDNIPTVTNVGVMGCPLINFIPEDLDNLPPGWKGLNEEYDYKADQSVLFTTNIGRGGSVNIHRTEFSPGGYRAFQKSGHGGIARRLGVKGIPGSKNFLEYMVPGIWANREGGITFLLLPQMAQHLYEAGFKSKDEVYEWIYRASFQTMKEYRTHSWPDVQTNSWLGIEKTSGKPYKELPDDYMVPLVSDPYESCIIVTGGGEEYPQWWGARKPMYASAYGIDYWR
ncbi:MAG: hypothetical protein JW712_13165 [Dehalococcoidales bacterium]|nr:hypothetical protein [Dehalococcoidales bacterium]